MRQEEVSSILTFPPLFGCLNVISPLSPVGSFNLARLCKDPIDGDSGLDHGENR